MEEVVFDNKKTFNDAITAFNWLFENVSDDKWFMVRDWDWADRRMKNIKFTPDKIKKDIQGDDLREGNIDGKMMIFFTDKKDALLFKLIWG